MAGPDLLPEKMMLVLEHNKSPRKARQMDRVYGSLKAHRPVAILEKHWRRDDDDEDDGEDDGDDDDDDDHHSSEQPVLPLSPPATGSTTIGDTVHATTTSDLVTPASISALTTSQSTNPARSHSVHYGTVSDPLTFITSTASSLASPSEITMTDTSVSTTTATSSASHTHPAIGTLTGAPSVIQSETHEPQNALKAGVSIAAISVIIALVYVLFRFCTPIRSRWLLRQDNGRLEREKRLGLNDILPPPAAVATLPARSDHAAAPSDVETGEVQGAHLLPPSYRSRYTASGASWVADGWLGDPNRLSNRLTDRWRRSDGSMRRMVFGHSRFSDSSSGSENEKQDEPRQGGVRRGTVSGLSAADSNVRSEPQNAVGRESRASEASDMYGSEVDAHFDFQSPPPVLLNGRLSTGSGRELAP